MCDHICDTVMRYDRDLILTCLIVCETCGTERVTETLAYEPNYLSTPVATLQGDARTL